MILLKEMPVDYCKINIFVRITHIYCLMHSVIMSDAREIATNRLYTEHGIMVVHTEELRVMPHELEYIAVVLVPSCCKNIPDPFIL